MLMDGRRTDAGVIGILIAHLGAFGSGDLKMYYTVESHKFKRQFFEITGLFKEE